MRRVMSGFHLLWSAIQISPLFFFNFSYPGNVPIEKIDEFEGE
jgi:hypothetical protein